MGRLRSWLRSLLGGNRTGHDRRFALLEREIQAINKFPDQNPNPVMRLDRDGHLLYANQASRAVIEALGVRVGDTLAADRWAELQDAAVASGRPIIELASGGLTFALLPVDVPELGVINLYGTDITAAKALDKFPDRNPNPVLRVAQDGRLIYANPASAPICRALGASVGGLLPPAFAERVLAAADTASGETIEIRSEDRIFELLIVSVYEFDAINLYGTDVTAAREVERANAENERLLLNILPASIADRLRRGEVVIADRFDEMTVLFADVVGFTQLSLELSPVEIVETLNAVFSAFDRLAERHGLEKIKTIGDAYMVVGGLTDDGSRAGSRCPERMVAEMGLEMLRSRRRAARRDSPAARVPGRDARRPGGRGRHRHQEVHLRRVGRHGQHRQPDGVARRARTGPGHRGDVPPAARRLRLRAARAHRRQGQGPDPDLPVDRGPTPEQTKLLPDPG